MNTKENNFTYLLAALILFLVVLPIAADFGLVSIKLGKTVGYTLTLVIGIWSLHRSRLVFYVGMALVVAGIALNLGEYVTDSRTLAYLSQAMMFAFLFLATVTALKQVMFDPIVSPNRIYGAICVYLLLGLMWAILYAALYSVTPDAFRGASATQDLVWDVEWIYYSFITLTTLGYGDIVPVSGTARALAYSEAVFGVFYMAVLVAGIVSGYMSERSTDKS